jgi:hypothetical protein
MGVVGPLWKRALSSGIAGAGEAGYRSFPASSSIEQIMAWFSRPPLARVEPDCGPPPRLVVRPPRGDGFVLPLENLLGVLFLHVGDAFLGGEEGWWVFETATGEGCALSVDCPSFDAVLRATLAPSVDTAPRRERGWVEARPAPLRRGSDGVVRLTAAELGALRDVSGKTLRPLRSIVDAPVIV